MREPSAYETLYWHSSPLQLLQRTQSGWLRHERGTLVDDCRASNRVPALWWPQCWHPAHGIAISAEPVSTISSKVLGGVPTQTSAALAREWQEIKREMRRTARET